MMIIMMIKSNLFLKNKIKINLKVKSIITTKRESTIIKKDTITLLTAAAVAVVIATVIVSKNIIIITRLKRSQNKVKFKNHKRL